MNKCPLYQMGFNIKGIQFNCLVLITIMDKFHYFVLMYSSANQSNDTRAKMNNLVNVVHNLFQCCAAHCQKLLSATILQSCSRSTIIVQSLLTTINKLFSSTIVSSCSNNIVTIIVLCQHQTSID